MLGRAALALLLAGAAAPAQADSASWNGRWSGRLSTGADVSIIVDRGKVKEYRFGQRSASIAYAEVTADRVSFSPGSAAIITMVPAGQDQANYTFTHPQMGTFTSVLSRTSSQAAATAARVSTRVPKAWLGTWGRQSGWMLTASSSSLAYSYQGAAWAISNISADETSLAFDVPPRGRMVLTMRPDQKADYVFTRGDETFRGTVWRR